MPPSDRHSQTSSSMGRRVKRAMGWPKYMQDKQLKGGVTAFYWVPPTWAMKADPPCPLPREALGQDFGEAKRRCDQVLNPAFDEWRRTRALSDEQIKEMRQPAAGTFGWMVLAFFETSEFKVLSPKTRHEYRLQLEALAARKLKGGSNKTLGQVPLADFDPPAAKTLFNRLRTVREELGDGTVVERDRTNMALKMIGAVRRAWSVLRTESHLVPADNPFKGLALRKPRSKETPAATFDELLKFVQGCDERGRSSIGTAALIAWEWVQRPEHICCSFEITHYKPRERRRFVQVLHEKTEEEAWVPLDDPETGDRAYPLLEDRLDELCKDRIGGLVMLRDWPDKAAGKRLPWRTARGDISYFRHETRRLIDEIGLRPELTFASFRHGGMTEAAESGVTELQLRALSRHKTLQVLPRYAKKTSDQVAEVGRKRRQLRAKRQRLSE